ncbi:MAG TPA: hypothetical protein VN253_15760, partial [Kofleriaceae bacterium]|nr:hypothetical protein [Kofleriaceae bacterium]
AGSACDLPTAQAGTPEELAWRIFVAISCKTQRGQLTWETWKTQACIKNPADCPVRRLHPSVLAAVSRKAAAPDGPKRTGGCSPMTTAANADSSLKPFLPGNLSSDPVFCEEVTINPAEDAYAKENGLLTSAGQGTFLEAGKTVAFPAAAVEVKADWVPASSFTNVTLDCSKPNPAIYQEMIDGTCYALTSIHLSSKLYPNWLWATFEPQYVATNPNRCKPNLYNACNDPWGSSPATSTGAPTQPTAALSALFRGAGAALDPSFQNYRLVGVQTEYTDPAATHGVLGNSFTEFNADVPAGQASCITCHANALYDVQKAPNGVNPNGGPFPGGASVGTPTPPPGPSWKPLDFSWFLGFGVPAQ